MDHVKQTDSTRRFAYSVTTQERVPEEKRQFGRAKRSWGHNVKTSLQKVWRNTVDGI
jgi:hypothetical protein